MPFSSETLKRGLVPLLLSLLGIALFSWLVPAEAKAVDAQLLGFPDSDAPAHLMRPKILGVICFLPALGGIAYASGGVLARYLARQFLGIFMICFGSLLTIWLLMDLQNNLGDLRQSDELLRTLTTFYGTRLPAILLLLLPYSLLLSLLYCLGKLSKSREIVAMIQTGRSLPRICLPLILAGVLSALLCAGLNYHWAPVADGASEDILQEAKGASVMAASNVLYRNPPQHRLWMVGTFPKDYEKGRPLQAVEVTTTRPNGSLKSRLSAARASWNPVDRTWVFEGATVGLFEPDMPPDFTEYSEPLVQPGWPETPWQLIKPALSAPYLGIPDLNGWLLANAGNELSVIPAPYLTQWHYRWAQPWVCLVTVLLAAPLGIHFSRRGSTGGVAMAVALSVALLFLTTVFLALGEATYIAPALAAWAPNAIFALLGVFLFQRRMAGRPLHQTLRRLFQGA
jgi:lipopolysaccharide export system permease protein